MTGPSLRVLVVAADAKDARFAAQVLSDFGDEAEIAGDVHDALQRLTRARFDLALISLSLPRGDGLALVHHVRALYPSIDVVVLSTTSEIEDAAHAMALGVLQSVMLPLTGDALLVAAGRSRERQVLIAERTRLTVDEARSRRRTATYSRCAALVSETDTSAMAERLLDACAGEVALRGGAVYLPQGPGLREHARVASLGPADVFPSVLGDADIMTFDPTQIVQERQVGDVSGYRVSLFGDTELAGWIDLLPEDTPIADRAKEGLELVGHFGAAAFTAKRRIDAIARFGIKDPDTSAYTFAYFGDVAGREIDRAARHGRRFALLTVNVEGLGASSATMDSRHELRRAMTDAILESVRDSDVLARVEDDEYYLLLPESGLLGGLAARRRIHRRFREVSALRYSKVDPTVGISVYPVDGSDLGTLLRVSRRRSDRSRDGVWRRLNLGEMRFWEALGTLLGSEDDVGLRADGSIALHPDLAGTRDQHSLARHFALPRSLLPRLGATLTQDAVRHRVAGTVYAAGDPVLEDAVSHAAAGAEVTPVRVWVLGEGKGVTSPFRLPIHDGRLQSQVMMMSLTEMGGYVLVGRQLSEDTLFAYHASDLDVVDGLVTSLQSEYYLQRETG